MRRLVRNLSATVFHFLENGKPLMYDPDVLKPQDIVVLLRLIGTERSDWDFGSLRSELGINLSALHRAITRLTEAQLFSDRTGRVRSQNAHEFIVHAVRYIVPAREGAVATGVPTGASAEPLLSQLVSSQSDAVDSNWVWPHPTGQARGLSVVPLIDEVPRIAEESHTMHLRLAALDGIRIGRARERRLAAEWFRSELGMP